MSANSRYPKLVIDLGKLRYNVEQMKIMCESSGVELAGVIKGFSAFHECVEEFEKAGCSFLASSRIDQLEHLKEKGIQTPLMLIRIPMISEAEDVVRCTDISLNSEIDVLKELNRQARIQDRKHQVILMVDLGDLREGFWDRKELLEAALLVENEFHNLELAGIGTNLGCYGAIAATPEKLEELVECAEMIETEIGRQLRYISGGATSTLPRIAEGNLPQRINMLRVGEGIILANVWGHDILGHMHRDVFTLRTEVIEVKDKPTYPVGDIMYDAFGNKPEYEDRGVRRRALIGLGKVDYAFPEELLPRQKGVKVIGASSDHTILDVEDAEHEIKVGDIIEFDLQYSTMVYVTNSPNVQVVYI